MTRTRSPKGQLGDKDYEVLRAFRWTWWRAATPQIEAGNDVSSIHLDADRVYRSLRQAGLVEWMTTDQVSYRMRKLEKFGYLKGVWGRGNYSLTPLADPQAHQMAEDWAKRQKVWSQEIGRRIESFIATIDRLVPGHTLRIRQDAYLRPGENLANLSVTVGGRISHLQIILRLAERQLLADEEAHQDDVS